MQKKKYLLSGLLLWASVVHAQTNLVITQPVSSTPGMLNTLIGVRAGMTSSSATTGASNVFVGAGTGQQNTTGSQNTFLGSNSGGVNTTGSDNVMLGAYNAFNNFHTGNANVFIGSSAGEKNQVGSANTLVGFETSVSNTLSGNNTIFGYQAGIFFQSSNSSGNSTVVGAIARSFGDYNTNIGYKAQTGLQYNTSIGTQAGSRSYGFTGSSNVTMGTNAGSALQTGSANFFLGDNAGGTTTSGGYNVYLGANAGNGEGVNGSNNVAVGFESGRNNRSNTGDPGSKNTFLGFRADVGGSLWYNATAVGANARVSASNAVVLGDVTSGINVGIGTTAPSVRLEVVSSTSGTSGLRLSQLTATTSTSLNATKFLTVNASGDVILANYTSGAREATGDLLWQRRNGYLQSTNGEALILGQDVSQIPAEYKLLVEKGILTERLKVAVKNSSEWSDYVFSRTYKLTPLTEVEHYIKTNRHLPGIPSGQEMVEQGNDLHHTDALLLAKIEELTLYAIKADQLDKQQQREITRLRQENRYIRQRLKSAR